MHLESYSVCRALQCAGRLASYRDGHWIWYALNVTFFNLSSRFMVNFLFSFESTYVGWGLVWFGLVILILAFPTVFVPGLHGQFCAFC